MEDAGRRELAELVADHVFADGYRDVLVPLWTPKVRPTNCGRIVERRLQILMMSLRPLLRALSALRSR
jgi:hypothetical protein